MHHYYQNKKDYLDIKNEATLVKDVVPLINRGDLRAVSDFASSSGAVTGSTPNLPNIRYLPMGQGRWLNQADEDQRRRVCVLGYQMRKNLFPGRPATGSFIILNDVRFEIVGELAHIGRQENNMNNVRMYIPFSTMRMYFPMKTERTIDDISAMNLQPVSRDRHAAALDQVHRIIARNHGFDPKNKEAFEGWDTVANAEMVGKLFTGMEVFLGSVGMVTVVLGAIGIINIVLVSVTERTREIGLMKAVGATHRHILMQFFLEGLFLTALSGGVGIGVTQALMTLMKVAPLPPMFDPPHIVPAAAAPAVASLSIAGIGAGLYPAPKAAMLRPVDALRTDER